MTETIKVEGFDVRIRKEGSVYIATVLELPGCVTDGKSREEVIRNAKSAIGDYLSTVARNFRPPRSKSRTRRGNGEIKTAAPKKRKI